LADDSPIEIKAADRYFTSHEVAKILGITRSSVVKWISQGKLNAFRTLGGHRRVPAAELVRFAREHGMPIPEALRELAIGKVLVVDDDPRFLRSLQRAFKPHADEFQLETAESGVKALMLLGSLKPEVLFLDLQLPALDGFEVLKAIKSNPETKAMAVIVMSGHMDEAKCARGKKLGAAMCLEKPVNISELMETLRELRKPRQNWSR
jgi:excisionase family DNA binding protein